MKNLMRRRARLPPGGARRESFGQGREHIGARGIVRPHAPMRLQTKCNRAQLNLPAIPATSGVAAMV